MDANYKMFLTNIIDDDINNLLPLIEQAKVAYISKQKIL